jgi:hypothetical protein
MLNIAVRLRRITFIYHSCGNQQLPQHKFLFYTFYANLLITGYALQDETLYLLLQIGGFYIQAEGSVDDITIWPE